MGDEMGTFRVTVEIENPVRSGERRTLESVLVDTGATAAARRHRPRQQGGGDATCKRQRRPPRDQKPGFCFRLGLALSSFRGIA